MRQECLIRRPLPAIACPSCGDMLNARPGSIVTAENWLDCLRRCSICEVGISNARRNPSVLFNDPRLNVPQEVRVGVLDTLAMAHQREKSGEQKDEVRL